MLRVGTTRVCVVGQKRQAEMLPGEIDHAISRAEGNAEIRVKLRHAA
jgi:hypothetical protein